MVQGYRQEPPTDDQHRAGHLASATLDDQIDGEDKAKKPGNDERSRNDLAPCLPVTGAMGEARLRLHHLFYQRLDQLRTACWD